MKAFTIISVFLLSIFSISGSDISPIIIIYKDMDQVTMLAKYKPTTLFFKANWCPSCRSAAKDFEENKDKLNGVNLVVVNYDTAKDLKTKYGVTYQHTFVQVDANGEQIAVWSGGATEELLENIVKRDK